MGRHTASCESCGLAKWSCDDCGFVYCFTPRCRQFQPPQFALASHGCLLLCRACA